VRSTRASRRAAPAPMHEPEAGEALVPYLSLARKAGSLEIGFRAVRRALHRGRVHLLILATDAGASLSKIDTGTLPVISPADRATLGAWLGRKEIAILGLTDPHLARAVREKA